MFKNRTHLTEQLGPCRVKPLRVKPLRVIEIVVSEHRGKVCSIFEHKYDYILTTNYYMTRGT